MKIGFIGVGNMGGALVRAAAAVIPCGDILVTDHNPKKAEAFLRDFGIKSADNNSIAAQCDYIFLGVKPQMMDGVIAGIKDTLTARKDAPVLVSMAAGLTADYISHAAGDLPTVRIMPNTPASVGEGVVLMCAADNVNSQAISDVKNILSRAGVIDEIPERLIDAASAVAGCGPAFLCMFAQALADGAVECGVPRANANLYAQQMILGTAKLMLETGEHPEKLKDAVCSPGGSTIAGVHALEDLGMRSAVMSAVRASYDRTLEMKK